MWKNLVVGAVGSILAVGVLAATQKIGGWMAAVFFPTVPAGAIVAFAENCPEEGWKLYKHGEGRFLLGADMDKGFKVTKTGGKENHTLTVDQMPSHKHDRGGDLLLVKVTGRATSAHVDRDGANEFDNRTGHSMEAVGKGKPIAHMPPYIVVNFCEKE